MRFSRRDFLRLPRFPSEAGTGALVVLFLRGGADGLNLVPPHGEEAYYKARPSLSVARPDDGGAIDLDGFFGLHPGLAPLLPIYNDKEMAVVHAVGSEDRTRSHFEAQDLMEHGCPVNKDPGSGWVARYLRTVKGRLSPLSAVAISDVLPESLRGSPGASAVRSVEEFSLHLGKSRRSGFIPALESLYRKEGGGLGRAGLHVLDTVEAIDRLRQGAETGPREGLAHALHQATRLIRADVGLRVACVDFGGWDSHFVQGAIFDGLAEELGEALASFFRDVRDRRVTVVVMTEFGRRLTENASLGTDHGRGSVMFVLGKGIRGGRVYGDWPGLGRDDLEGPGDLRVTTDYRNVLAEIVQKRMGNDRTADIFPGHSAAFPGLVE